MRALVASPLASACARHAGGDPTAVHRAASSAVASTSARVLCVYHARIPTRGCRVSVSQSPGSNTRAFPSCVLGSRAVRPTRFSRARVKAASGNGAAPAPPPASGPVVRGTPEDDENDVNEDDENDVENNTNNNTTNQTSDDPDEPAPTDALLVACGVGLLTGLGVAVFNIAEHGVHDLVFLTTTVYSPDRFQVEGARDVRLATAAQAVATIAAPTLAGCLVTGLRFLAGGFDGETKPRWPAGWVGGSPVGGSVTKDDDGTSNTGTDTGSDTGTDTTGDGTGTSSWFTGARAALRPALKAAAAVVTLGAGASLGPEGPSVEIGAAIAGSLNEASTGTGGVAGGRGGSTHETNRQKAIRKKINQSRRLGLVAAGSAAGISAGFGAPIAGLFFAFEAVLQPAQMRRNAALALRGVGGSGGGGTDDDDLDTDGGGGSTGFGASTTESVILASVLAAVVSNALLGEQPAFVVPAFELKNLAELPLYLPLGLLCGGVAVAFRASSSVLGVGFAALERGAFAQGREEGTDTDTKRTDDTTGDVDKSSPTTPERAITLRIPREWHAPLGGFVFGCVATAFPEVTYQGFDNVNSMLGASGSPYRTPYSPELLFQLVFVKLTATSLCRQSGLVGGVYAPSLFMGAALGSAYGAALVPLALAGAPVAPPQAYALVGMAGVLAGICRVPLTAILLLFELTHDYRIIVPLMGTVGVASWVSGAAERKTLGGTDTKTNLKSYVAAEVPAGKQEGVVGASGLLSFDDDDDDVENRSGNVMVNSVGTDGARTRNAQAFAAARAAAAGATVADATRSDVPRVKATASALDCARAAVESVREGSAQRCAVVVDNDGTLRGVATARSLAAVLAEGRGGSATALDACDAGVPTVSSSWTLVDAERAMKRNRVTLAAVVATILSTEAQTELTEEEGGIKSKASSAFALGVLEAGAAVAERDAAALGAALRAHESFVPREE